MIKQIQLTDPVSYTHLAKEVGDRIVFMDGGNILESEKPQEFFENPKNERTKEFLSKVL